MAFRPAQQMLPNCILFRQIFSRVQFRPIKKSRTRSPDVDPETDILNGIGLCVVTNIGSRPPKATVMAEFGHIPMKYGHLTHN